MNEIALLINVCADALAVVWAIIAGNDTAVKRREVRCSGFIPCRGPFNV